MTSTIAKVAGKMYLCLQKLESVCLENKERRAERGFTT